MCLDGFQNCGVYVTVHNLLEMADKKGEIDVFEAVQQVRSSRPQFIKDVTQYTHLYLTVRDYISNHTQQTNLH